jgi:MFS family permease
MKATFSSLRIRNYRRYFLGQLVSMCGTWMQVVAMAWLVLDLTGSGTSLGLVTASQFLPVLLLGPWGGLIADRFDKRRLLAVTQTVSGLLAALLAVIVATGVVEVWMVEVLALGLGLTTVFDTPARQTIIAELVPPEELRNAVTLNSVMINAARIVGPAIAGLLIALVGESMCFALNAASFGAVLVSLFFLDSSINPAPVTARARGQLRDGFRYVARTPELLLCLVMILVVGTMAWELNVTVPLIAKQTFGGGAGTIGLMMSMMGVGAVCGGLVSASRGAAGLRGLAHGCVGWGVALLLAAAAPTLPAEMAAMALVGYGSIAFSSSSKTCLQLGAAPEMRGRVMAMWSMCVTGTIPIGGPLVGWIGEQFGARWSFVAGGVPTIAVGLVAYRVLARHPAFRTGEPTADVAVAVAA